MPTVKELRQELASLGLTIHGRKATLEARLRAAKAAGQSTESNNLIVGGNGIAAHENTNAWTASMIQRNVHQSTRKTYLTKQKKMGVWALSQPNLKDHVHDGIIAKEGLKLMANEPEYFLTFLTWLAYPDGNIPAEFDENETMKCQGFETLCSYRKALHKQFQENQIHKSKDYNSVVSTLFSGVARNDARIKQEQGLLTGKDAMNFPY